jgi:hypothetical protein
VSKQEAGGAGGTSTLADLTPGRRALVDDAIRYAFVAFVVAVIVLGLTDRFGPRSATVSASSPALSLEVRYDEVVRPGLSATWSVEIAARDGRSLPERLTLVTTSTYFELFDENGLSPEPVEETSGASTTTWVFEPEPHATNLVVELDARIQPGWRAPVSGTTTLVVEGEEPLHVDYRTWPLP